MEILLCKLIGRFGGLPLFKTLLIALKRWFASMFGYKGYIVFGTAGGRWFGENPGYLYRYMIQKEDGRQQLIWISNREEVADYVNRIGGRACIRHSLKALGYCLGANIFVISHGHHDVLPYCIDNKRDYLINLTHGFGVKRCWFAIKDDRYREHRGKGALDRIRTQRSYLMALSDYVREQIRVDTGYYYRKKEIILTGLARNDFLLAREDSLPELVPEAKEIYESIKQKYTVLYAPTWRDWASTRYFPFPDFAADELDRFLERNNIILTLRPHEDDLKRGVSRNYRRLQGMRNVIIARHAVIPDVQILLKYTDILLSDYSSIWYDFLLLDRPLLFIPYDYESFRAKRGFHFDYMDDHETPGPKISSMKDFYYWVERFLGKGTDFQELRNNLKRKVHQYRDGNSCKRISAFIEDIRNHS